MSKKILIVDDEAYVLNVLSKFLEGRNWDVAKAENGQEAIRVYDEYRPHIVLLDIRMPGKDGITTLEELLVKDPEANIIMVTAVHEEDIAKRAMERGAFDYITKPIDPYYLELCLQTKLTLLNADP